MNERIKELAEQAAINAVAKNFTGQALEVRLPSENWAKEFAQLIIQDVLKIMQDRKEDYDNPGTYMDEKWYIQQEAKSAALDDMMDDIRYHFKDEE